MQVTKASIFTCLPRPWAARQGPWAAQDTLQPARGRWEGAQNLPMGIHGTAHHGPPTGLARSSTTRHGVIVHRIIQYKSRCKETRELENPAYRSLRRVSCLDVVSMVRHGSVRRGEIVTPHAEY